jgi:hypothetical protein
LEVGKLLAGSENSRQPGALIVLRFVAAATPRIEEAIIVLDDQRRTKRTKSAPTTVTV